MLETPRNATAHWLRFLEGTIPEQLLRGKPAGAGSWKMGPPAQKGPMAIDAQQHMMRRMALP